VIGGRDEQHAAAVGCGQHHHVAGCEHIGSGIEESLGRRIGQRAAGSFVVPQGKALSVGEDGQVAKGEGQDMLSKTGIITI
jgi:hypothetical protein